MQTTQVPLFPLQVFLLPSEVTALHIFEERYRQLLDDCENMHAGFGIPFAENGYLSGIGCMVKVKQIIKRYTNGSADIEVECTGFFRIEEYYNRLGQKMYPGGEVVPYDINEMPKISNKLLQAIDNYIIQSGEKVPEEIFNAGLTSFDVGRILKLSVIDKIKLVKLESPEQREIMLLNQIKLLQKLIIQQNSIMGDIFLN